MRIDPRPPLQFDPIRALRWREEAERERRRRRKRIVKGKVTEPRPVECVETGEQFESIAAAARKFQRLHALSNIKSALQTGHSAYGFHWRYLHLPTPAPRPRRNKPVRCKETGELFPSIKAAADAENRHWQSLYRALVAGSQCNERHFEYALDCSWGGQ